MNIDFPVLKSIFFRGLNELRAFQFSFSNPVFWLFMLLLFLILLKSWEARKSFSFCWKIAIILLATTASENFVGSIVTQQGGSFDPIVVRVIFIILIIFIFLYYLFVYS